MKNLFLAAAFITTFSLLILGINASSIDDYDNYVFECMDDIYECNVEYFGVHPDCVISRYYVNDVCDYPEFGCRIDLEPSGTGCGDYPPTAVTGCFEDAEGYQHEIYQVTYSGSCSDYGVCVVESTLKTHQCESGVCDYALGECAHLKCYESDGGENYLEYSTCTDNFGSDEDKCDGNTLYEYYCNPSMKCDYEEKECDGDCKSGACLDCPEELIANDGQPCTDSSECCIGCFGTQTSSSYTCHSSCAVVDTYAADSKACCSGAPYIAGKCEISSVTSGICDVYNTNSIYDYNRRLNCESDTDCMWCGSACPPGTSDCDSCKESAGHYCCYETVYQTTPCEGCNSPIPNAPSTSCDYIGGCFPYNSCPGTTVTVDMSEEPNRIQGCMSTDTSYSHGQSGSHQAHWYNVKGALGEPVNISFKNNNCIGSLNLFVFNKGDCDLYDNIYYSAAYYQVASISAVGDVFLKNNPGVPSGFADSLPDDADIPNKVLRINKMPFGGLILAIDSDCNLLSCPYCILINATQETQAVCG